MSKADKEMVFIMVGGFFAIIGLIAFLIALYGFITGNNLTCE